MFDIPIHHPVYGGGNWWIRVAFQNLMTRYSSMKRDRKFGDAGPRRQEGCGEMSVASVNDTTFFLPRHAVFTKPKKKKKKIENKKYHFIFTFFVSPPHIFLRSVYTPLTRCTPLYFRSFFIFEVTPIIFAAGILVKSRRILHTPLFLRALPPPHFRLSGASVHTIVYYHHRIYEHQSHVWNNDIRFFFFLLVGIRVPRDVYPLPVDPRWQPLAITLNFYS